MLKNKSLLLMALFYLLAGINHFRKPLTYYSIIPPYFHDHYFRNIIAGMAEILFAVLLLIPITKKYACYGIILMLIAFIPSHIYMIKAGFCIEGYCLPQWTLWFRLFVLQPLLVWWAWSNRK